MTIMQDDDGAVNTAQALALLKELRALWVSKRGDRAVALDEIAELNLKMHIAEQRLFDIEVDMSRIAELGSDLRAGTHPEMVRHAMAMLLDSKD